MQVIHDREVQLLLKAHTNTDDDSSTIGTCALKRCYSSHCTEPPVQLRTSTSDVTGFADLNYEAAVSITHFRFLIFALRYFTFQLVFILSSWTFAILFPSYNISSVFLWNMQIFSAYLTRLAMKFTSHNHLEMLTERFIDFHEVQLLDLSRKAV